MSASTPGPCSPIALSIPLGVSAMRGGGVPSRGRKKMPFETMPPSARRSSSGTSVPYPNVPEAPSTGPRSFSAPMSADISVTQATATISQTRPRPPGPPNPKRCSLPPRQPHRCHSQPSADQHGCARAGGDIESTTKRAKAADAVALTHREQLRRPRTHGLQDDLDSLAIDSIDGEGPAQQWTRRPADIHKLTRQHAGSDLPSVHRAHG